MRSLDDTLEVVRELFPTTFFVEEVNQFFKLVFINEDEGAASLTDNDFGMVIILRILKMLYCFENNLTDDERNFCFHTTE